MRTYVVNLARRQDRRRRMESMLPLGLDAHFSSDWEGQFDGSQIDLNDLVGYRVHPGWELPIKSGNQYWDRPLRSGEVGCSISHLRCWEDACQRAPDEPILVLEDDVALSESFEHNVKSLMGLLDTINSDWGLLYLGRSKQGHDRPVAPGLVEAGFSYGSYAYVLSPCGLRKVCDAKLGRAIIPVDEFLPAMYLDHPRPDIRLLFPQGFSAFAASPVLVRHVSDGTTDTEGN